MPPVSIGQRDRLVTIEFGVLGAGASRQPTVDWTDTQPIDVYMSRMDVSGREQRESAQLQAEVDTEWEMPYLATMDPELVDVPKYRRLKYAGRRYDIQRAVIREATEGKQIRLWTLARSG